MIGDKHKMEWEGDNNSFAKGTWTSLQQLYCIVKFNPLTHNNYRKRYSAKILVIVRDSPSYMIILKSDLTSIVKSSNYET